MTRAPRHTTLTDRAAAAERDRPPRLIGGMGDRGLLAVVPGLTDLEAWAAIRYVASRAHDAADCRLLLDVLGLLDLDEGLDLP